MEQVLCATLIPQVLHLGQRVKFEKVDTPSTIDTPYLERDPGLCFLISAFTIDKREDVQMAHINMGLFQPKLQKHPSTKHGGQGSSHNDAMSKWSNLKDSSKHIDKRMNAQCSQQILKNKLHLKTLIVTTKWLAKQACAFRGHDKSINSLKHGNFIELIKLLATMNEEINKVVLENAPKNAQYIVPKIQKELLNIIANKVRHKIREEVGDTKFCIIVDDALDESHKEQMTIILRYVDWDSFIRERFFEITGTGPNQVRTLQRDGDTHWSSHFTSVSRFIEMFGAILEVSEKMINDGFNFQLMELNSRISKQTVELLTLSLAFDLIDGFKSFDIHNICSLAKRFYPHDFTLNNVLALRRELEHYKIDMLSHPRFQNITSLSEL
ncbi:hypothetical protein CISIN_1g046640mg, partial [Citrus sinensis]